MTRWLDAAAIDRLMDPAHYLGMAGAFVDRALAANPHDMTRRDR